jgi:hypothetical protein
LKALDVLAKWNDDIESKVQKILNNDPEVDIDFRTWGAQPTRRSVAIKKEIKQ